MNITKRNLLFIHSTFLMSILCQSCDNSNEAKNTKLGFDDTSTIAVNTEDSLELNIHKVNEKEFIGLWQVVSIYTRGWPTRYSEDQFNQIKRSQLHFTSDSVYYRGINFLEPCVYDSISMVQFDTSSDNSEIVRLISSIYGPEHLVKFKIMDLISVQKPDDNYNNDRWSHFYYSGDTLINECSNYLIFLKKISDTLR